jgi:phospholipid/cholesterol/gamma-HCH transport system permease protein
VIAMPLLAAVFSAVGILGGWVVGVLLIGVDGVPSGARCRAAWMSGGRVGNGVIKSVVFGVP